MTIMGNPNKDAMGSPGNWRCGSCPGMAGAGAGAGADANQEQEHNGMCVCVCVW